MESVAAKSPRELTLLVEQVSGSEELKKDYDRLEAAKSQMEEKVAFSYQKRRGMAAERKQKKEQKEEAEKHLVLLEQQVEVYRDCSMLNAITHMPWCLLKFSLREK